MPEIGDEPAWYRLEIAAVTRRKCGGITGYGYAIFKNDHSNHLVATGGGPVQPAVTFNHAAHLAVVHGLRVAHSLGVARLVLQTDSALAVRQLKKCIGPFREQHETNVLLAAVADSLAGLADVQVQLVDRWANGMAIVQAEFATELVLLLPKVGSCPPSKYAHLAGQIGMLLLLPMSVRRGMEAAENFAETTAQLVALRCGSREQDLLAVIHNCNAAAHAVEDSSRSSSSSSGDSMNSSSSSSDDSSSSNITSSNSSNSGASLSSVGEVVPTWAPFTMERIYTDQEGAAYAAAAAAEAQWTSHLDNNAADTEDAGSKPHKLVRGRVVGRHRLDNRYLVVGFHTLPANWQPGRPLVQQQQKPEQQVQSAGSSEELPAAALLDSTQAQQQQQQQQQQEPRSTTTAEAAAAAASAAARQPETFWSASAAAAAAGGGGGSVDDVLLSAWQVSSGAASSSEAVGLGTSRYSLPHVNSDTATHLLQFDGASRNNPGRGGYGYVVFDLTSGRLVERGCMSLPYGQTAGRAEFEGLLAGLAAALNLGIRTLAVQGDSALVLDALMYRRGISSKHVSVLYHKAAQLLAQFDHVDFQYIPREQNSMADRLANMSMDLDTALYALLRKDERGVTGLKVVTKAARMAKRLDALRQLLEQYDFPLLLVVLLQRVMAITPQQLLQRLQDKALRLGDPNPWLVQEVRKLTEAGIPRALAEEVGAAVMDKRYTTAGMRAMLRNAAAHRQQQQPTAVGPPGQMQQTRSYSTFPVAAAAAAVVTHTLAPCHSCQPLFGSCELVGPSHPASCTAGFMWHAWQGQQHHLQGQQHHLQDSAWCTHDPGQLAQLANRSRWHTGSTISKWDRLLSGWQSGGANGWAGAGGQCQALTSTSSSGSGSVSRWAAVLWAVAKLRRL